MWGRGAIAILGVLLAGCGALIGPDDGSPGAIGETEITSGMSGGVAWSYSIELREGELCEWLRFDDDLPEGGCSTQQPLGALPPGQHLAVGCSGGTGRPAMAYGRTTAAVAVVRVDTVFGEFSGVTVAAPGGDIDARFFAVAMPPGSWCDRLEALSADGRVLETRAFSR